jgi:3-dehydroquinate dehydratase-2
MKLLIINGPNINFVGIREKGIYGEESYDQICERLMTYAKEKGFELEIWQSNHEGAIIDKIQSVYNTDVKGVVINPGAYTHYSYAIADAIKSVDIPFIEVHFSDINSREDFRKVSVTKAGCIDQISGFGAKGYFMAIDKLIEL